VLLAAAEARSAAAQTPVRAGLRAAAVPAPTDARYCSRVGSATRPNEQDYSRLFVRGSGNRNG